MGFAVELYFDSKTEKSVWDIRHTLVKQGITSTLGNLADRPHVSLAVFSNVDVTSLVSLTKEYANKIEPFDFQLISVGTFPGDENVLFLSPELTNQLKNYHRDFHLMLSKSNLAPSTYYIPEKWVPHCSVEMNIPNRQFQKAIEICRETFTPLIGQFREIGVVEFRPIKPLAVWPLNKMDAPSGKRPVN